MTTIIKRSALVFHGHNPAPNVAAEIVDGPHRRIVTWDDVMQERRERQAKRLRELRKSGVREWRAYKLWTAYFDQRLMGGWGAFLENRDERIWIDRDRRWLKEPLMRLFPLLLPLADDRDQWEAWKVEFARQHRRRMQDRRPLGVAFVWFDGVDVRRGQ